jgi:hypothetical protein
MDCRGERPVSTTAQRKRCDKDRSGERKIWPAHAGAELYFGKEARVPGSLPNRVRLLAMTC